MQESKKVSVSSSELNPDINEIGLHVLDGYAVVCDDVLTYSPGVLDYFEMPDGSFVPVDEYLELLLDECDRKEVSHVD